MARASAQSVPRQPLDPPDQPAEGRIGGLAFSVLMDLPLLYPVVMLRPVRAAHLVEIGVSNFVFGVLAGLILLAGSPRPKRTIVSTRLTA